MQVFDYSDYKLYLKAHMEHFKIKGALTKLAKAIDCHLPYLSKVLNDYSHLTLEQAAKLNNYLRHSSQEAEYFIYLVSLERSGNIELRGFYQEKLKQIKRDQSKAESKVKKTKKIKFEDEAKYFSHWLYSAVFVLCSIPEFQTPEAISQKLRVPLPKINKTLEFLISLKIIKKEKELYKVAEQRIHLSGNSPLIRKHHTNLRLKAIQEIDDESYAQNLHFSTIYSMSKSDFESIRAKLLGLINDIEPIVMKSNEEEAVTLCMDFFKL